MRSSEEKEERAVGEWLVDLLEEFGEDDCRDLERC